MIPKQIEVGSLLCLTDGAQDVDDWEVPLTSIDPGITATGYGDTGYEAFEDAKDAFQFTAEAAERVASG